MALSHLRASKAESRDKPYKLADGEGLYLLVNPNGSKLWRMNYREGGKQKTASFGPYPLVGLADARRQRDELKLRLRAGVRHMKTGAPTFKELALRWHEGMTVRWTDWYAARVMTRFEQDVFPQIGELPITSLEPPDILKVVRQVEARGAIELAARISNHCSGVFRLGVAEGICQRDPTADIKGALKPRPKVQHRAAVPWHRMGEFLLKLDRYDGSQVTRDALMFTILTLVRTGETRFATADEFEGLNGDRPLWRIPAERMKMGSEHLVPLSRQAVEIVQRYVGEGRLFGTLSENTMLYAMYRMGYHSRATVHGFRGTASTWLNEKEYPSDWIELQLSHQERNRVRAAYNSARWIEQRRTMLQDWADALDVARLG